MLWKRKVETDACKRRFKWIFCHFKINIRLNKNRFKIRKTRRFRLAREYRSKSRKEFQQQRKSWQVSFKKYIIYIFSKSLHRKTIENKSRKQSIINSISIDYRLQKRYYREKFWLDWYCLQATSSFCKLRNWGKSSVYIYRKWYYQRNWRVSEIMQNIKSIWKGYTRKIIQFIIQIAKIKVSSKLGIKNETPSIQICFIYEQTIWRRFTIECIKDVASFNEIRRRICKYML